MEQQNIANGGMQIVIPNLKEQQIIYLDFDGELTSYNGEILTIDNVVVQDSSLTEERIANIVAQLNAQYSAKNVIFVTQKPENTEYSTIYIGKTTAFDSYGNFAGLAETIDENNSIKNDNAFVMLDATTSDEEIISTITHETDHLLGTLDHGGDGIDTYAAWYVSSGVTSTGLFVWDEDVVMYVAKGGTVNNTTLHAGGMMEVNGTANNTFVYENSYMYVAKGGTANNTIVDFDGTMLVSSGGTANNTTINYGGCINIISGGTTLEIRENGGDVYIQNGANVTFVSNTIDGEILNTHHMTVHQNTVANRTIVNKNCSILVYSGGIANYTTVDYYGSMNVYSGGTAKNTTVNGGFLDIESTGKHTGNLLLTSGATVSAYAGSIIDFTVSERKSTDDYLINNLSLISGTPTYTITVSSTQEDGTYKLAQGAENFNGSISIGDGTLNYGSITVNGEDFVHNNVTYSLDKEEGNLLLNINTPPQYILIYSSGTLTSSYKEIDGAILVSGNNNLMHISSGGIANNTMASESWIHVSSGGIANNTNVNSQSYMYVYNDGTVNDTTVNYQGYMAISSGAVANNTTLNSGFIILYSGGIANHLSINSGIISIQSGGTALAIKENGGYVSIENGANVTFVSNAINGLTISNGMTVHKNTIANSTSITSMGKIMISSGGVANDTIVNSGRIYIHSHGLANNTIVNSSCEMFIDPNGKHQGSLQITSGAKVSAYVGSIIDFTISKQKSTDDYLINDLSKISGTPTYTITVSATQEYGTYKLAQGAENFNGSISIGDGTINYGAITVNGEDFIYNNVKYSLDNIDGNLLLNIGIQDLIPPESPIFVVSEKEMTNKDVIITATFSDDSEHKQYSINGDTWKDYTEPIVMTNNGIVSFRGIDAAGNISDITTYEVNNIDKVAPTLNITGNPTTWTNKDVTLTANVSDGIVEFFNGKEWVIGANQTITENGTYIFKVTDIAGNVTTKNVEVSFIDKIAPNKPTATANITYPTNKDITVAATFSDDSVTRQYSLDNKTWETYTAGITFTNTGIVYFRGIDAAGNISDVTEYTVNNIDKVAPTLNITGNPTNWTNKDVTLTANVNEGIVEFFNGSTKRHKGA